MTDNPQGECFSCGWAFRCWDRRIDTRSATRRDDHDSSGRLFTCVSPGEAVPRPWDFARWARGRIRGEGFRSWGLRSHDLVKVTGAGSYVDSVAPNPVAPNRGVEFARRNPATVLTQARTVKLVNSRRPVL
jgi:hypothetical protein